MTAPATLTTGRAPRRLHSPRPVVAMAAACLLLLCVAAASLMIGVIDLSLGQVARALTSDSDPIARNVVWQIRFPRLLDGMIVGASLAIAGALLQGVTRNPLGDPTILGITAAAGLASTILIVAQPQSAQWAVMMASAVGGLVGAAILFVIAWRGVISPVRLALAGVAVSAFFGAAIVAFQSSSRIFLQTSLGFLAGGLYGAEWSEFHAMWPYFVPTALVAVLFAGRLNVLALGDDVAAGLGLLTDRTRALILAVCGILTAVAVSAAGLVSFVGLVCPHIARFTLGSDNRFVIPASAIYGAVLVAGADLVARTIIRPTEIPMGIITAAIGAPFLLYLVRVRA